MGRIHEELTRKIIFEPNGLETIGKPREICAIQRVYKYILKVNTMF